jgi:hypothetical protein
MQKSQLDKGKPVARRGRKATDQANRLMAGLPKAGRISSPGNGTGFRKSGGSCVFSLMQVMV